MNEASSDFRVPPRWLLGAILAVLLAGTFAAVVAAQMTSEDPGKRMLSRAVAVITEIDATLPDIQADLREEAEGSSADQVQVPNFPIPIELPRDEALQIEGVELRARLLDEAAVRLYEDGMSSWADADPEADQAISRISSMGVLRWGLGLITERNHTLFVTAAILLGVLAAVPALLLLVAVQGYVRLIAMGIVTLAAALPSLAVALVLRNAIGTADDEADPFVSGLVDLGVDAMWVAVRDYLVLSALGLAIIALGGFALWWQARRGWLVAGIQKL